MRGTTRLSLETYSLLSPHATCGAAARPLVWEGETTGTWACPYPHEGVRATQARLNSYATLFTFSAGAIWSLEPMKKRLIWPNVAGRLVQFSLKVIFSHTRSGR